MGRKPLAWLYMYPRNIIRLHAYYDLYITFYHINKNEEGKTAHTEVHTYVLLTKKKYLAVIRICKDFLLILLQFNKYNLFIYNT